LPIEATTTTPLLTRRSDASAAGDSGQLSNAEPRDMFTTSMPSASARSKARMTMSSGVEPEQPNTR
jgi:hypothetical protein